ncbi:MAG TPA: ABC transporter permease subunit [Candidatus Krumholzibacteria bacterium]|nr:ABC transporter permease subunit [Candidatus Krumholzibacteria bacterium]
MSHGWRSTPRFWDRLARICITAGGLTLVAAVLAILVFIVREASPLAGRARVTPETAPPAPAAGALLAGTDDYRQLGFLVQPRGTRIFRLQDGALLDEVPAPCDSTATLTAATYAPATGLLALGSSDGHAAIARIESEARFQEGGRTLVAKQRLLGVAVLDSLARPLLQLSADRDAEGALAIAALAGDTPTAAALCYAFIDAEGEPLVTARLDAALEGKIPTSVVVSLEAGLLAAGTQDGTLFFWDLGEPDKPALEDHVNASDHRLGALQMLLGGQTLLVGADSGEISVWFRVRYARVRNDGQTSYRVEGADIAPGESRLFLDHDLGKRLAHLQDLHVETAGNPWTRVRSFRVHDAPVTQIAPSPRVRGFASLDAAGTVALHHATSERTLAVLEAALDHGRSLVFAPRGDGLVGLDAAGRAHVWGVHNPHPEASMSALFGKVWYEGYAAPAHVWQSTGGSDDFEPKLSLVPLFAGTLKGTLYAMLFSVPLAILGALYLSQLATPALRNLVKPAVELMAAVPSVVVGFLAALWLAPLLEAHLAAWGTAVLFLPLGLAAALGAWMLLPRTWRLAAPLGTELFFMLPFLAAAAWLGASLGAPAERWLFGGDLQQWMYGRYGVHYDQRNCVVVGMALGVAVIPIIFSICDDAMSSVPPSLTSAAFALGASRWQTALHVILPAASPGIFAAVMLGLGRAIGETMIVLMATGNTPILDFSPFNGMRTMSAAIAVEIPEAAQGGTLYRILFLTGTLLFVFTFLINTGADLISRHLRKRYAQF